MRAFRVLFAFQILLIFVHGLATSRARWRGLKIDASLPSGSGKPIWKTKINGLSTLSAAIPAAGYVSLPQGT